MTTWLHLSERMLHRRTGFATDGKRAERRGFRRRSDKCPDFRERMVRVKAAKRRACEGQPSRQSHSAHHTEQVTVYYPWHPLHGQTIRVQRSVRHGREVWLCEPDLHTAAIPVWMTDRVRCAALSIG